MKKTIIAAVAGLTLFASACGEEVDREGTRNELVKSLQAAGVVADGACIDRVLGGYSDDELLAMDKELSGGTQSEKTTAMLIDLMECATPTT